jgi:hypothetical protein
VSLGYNDEVRAETANWEKGDKGKSLENYLIKHSRRRTAAVKMRCAKALRAIRNCGLSVP